jgi:hypothetical protein
MNIAWCRITQSVTLDLLNGSSQFNEERFEFFKGLIERGHRIRLLSAMTDSSEKLYFDVHSDKVTEVAGQDVTWMKKMIYIPAGFCKSDDEILFIEFGAPNVMFSSKYLRGLPLFRTKDIARSLKSGIIFLLHFDPDQPLPLWKYTHTKYGWSDKNNPYRLETNNNEYENGKYNFKRHDNLEDYGWGDYSDFFTKDKKVVLFTKSMVPEIFANTYEGSRSMYATLYKKKLIDVIGLPTVSSHNYAKKVKFNDNPEFDVLYTGYPRKRENDFIKLFCNKNKKLKMAVTGPWSEKKKIIINDYSNINCMGNIPGFINMPKIINKSKVTLQLGVKKSKIFKWVTGRQFESILYKSIVLFDSEYDVMYEYFDKVFGLTTEKEANKKYLFLSNITNEQRYNLWRYQYEHIKNYNWDWFIYQFEMICKKYKILVKPIKYEWKEPIIKRDMKLALKDFIKNWKYKRK